MPSTSLYIFSKVSHHVECLFQNNYTPRSMFLIDSVNDDKIIQDV